MKKYTLWLTLLLLLTLVMGCGTEEVSEELIGDDLTAGPVSLDETAMTAKVIGGDLELYFPLTNDGTKKVKGEVTAYCKHLGGEEVFSGSSPLQIGEGEDTVVLKLDGFPEFGSTGEQAEWVVDYVLELDTGKIRGKRSLFMLLDKADLILLMPDKIMEGQVASIRAFLIDPRTNIPIGNQKIQLEATLSGGVRKTYEAETDEQGVAIIEMSAEEAGDLEVKVMVYGDETQGTVETNVQIVRESKLLLTTDKPMYQPGQTIHLRSLALNRFDKSPLSGDDIVFEVMDAKGNKVFKRLDVTNEFGVGWAEFTLATQVGLGAYTIRSTMGEVVSEKTVTVDRYSLPKFKVNATLNKGFYQPGQTVKGDVDVQYFFGKPVDGGKVQVQIFEYVGEWVPATEIVGTTNGEGLYSFEYQLPDYLIGQPLEDGKALVLMEITVTDLAEHEQKVAKQLLVTSHLLDVVAIPESGEVIPDIWNDFYLFVSDPTGTAVGGTLKLTVNGAELESDEVTMPVSGPAKVSLLPHSGQLELDIEADDGNGNTASRSFNFSVGENEANVLLRTDRALYKVGDTLHLDAYITGGYEHIFLDVVRKNQTMLTKTLEAVDGIAQLEIDLDQELSEDIVLSAYFLADSGQFIRDTAVVYVQPASSLNVEITTDKDEYMPGETAEISFAVKGEDEKPAQAALGLQVVDEAVYALSEIKPGLMKLYFQLEEELQNPTYQIGPANGFSLGGLISSGAAAEEGSDEDVAIQATTKAAFAAMGGNPLGQSELSTWKEALSQAKGALAPHFTTQKDVIRAKLEARLAVTNKDFDGACVYLKEYLGEPRYYDFWQNAFRFTINGESSWDCSIVLASNGPDELPDTEDDWNGSFSLWDLATGTWRGGQEMQMAGGWADDDGAFDANAGPPEAPNAEEGENEKSNDGDGGSDKSGVKVRSWFPETLFVEPSLITDSDGKITIEVPLADSITEWRMTTMANSQVGQLGSRTDGIVVFQDFFVDIDFPKYLTQNDEISFPVAIYNYLPTEQTIDIELMVEDWFMLLGEDSKSITLEAGEVAVVYFPVRVENVGWHKLTVYGMGDTLQDAVQRTVQVKPDGKEMVTTESARFDNDGENPSEDKVNVKLNFPDDSIAGSQTIVVKVLPGLSTHVVEGMESMLKLPGG
jgi:alpha-2-macroglobulin-like protein